MRRQAILKSLEPFDLTRETSCLGFVISSAQPDGTDIRIIFAIADGLFYFKDGVLVAYENAGELADVLESGNTVADLLAVEGVQEFLGQKIYPIIALDADSDLEVMPKIKLGVKVKCFRDEYTRDYYSPIYELKHGVNPARIYFADYESDVKGNATCSAQIRLKNMSGEFSDWIEFGDATGKEAVAVQIRSHHTVTTLNGEDEARIYNCEVKYITDSKNLSDNTLEIYTLPQEYYANLATCYALIKHSELIDADIKAYVTYIPEKLWRKDLEIGEGKGEVSTYYLGEVGSIDPGINQSTLRLNGDFHYNTNNATVEVSAESGVKILATYEYNHRDEVWIEMEKISTEKDADCYITRFYHRQKAGQKASAIKYELTRAVGKVEKDLGAGTGKLQVYHLAHRSDVESVNCTGAWKYDEATRRLEVTGTEEIKLSYEWAGEIPQVYSYVAGWTAQVYGGE